MLPKLITPVYPITLPFSQQKINIKPYTVGDEAAFITAISTEEEINILANFFELVSSCVVSTNFSIESLKLIDLFYILIYVRAKSSGEVVDIEKTCKQEDCLHKEATQLDIINSIELLNSEKKKKIIKIRKDLEVEITPVNAILLQEVYDGNGNLEVNTVASSISKVIIEGKIYTGFTKEDLIENVLSTMTKKQLLNIIDEMKDLISIRIKFNSTCTKCGKDSEYIIEELLDFLS